jgi:hypothetical protein
LEDGEVIGVNILFSSLSGHNQTESWDYFRVLQRLGHRVFRLPTPTFVVSESPKQWIEAGYAYQVTVDALIEHSGFQPDLFLYLEPLGLIPRGMERAPIPTACILCDTHQWLFARQQLALFFDYVFLYQRNYVQYFTAHPANHVQWLPYACDLELFHPSGVERDLDVAFVGQPFPKSTRRGIVMAELGKRYLINEQRYYRREEIPEIYSRAKIVLNMPLKDDLNFRTFEAMSCGAMLLTRRVNNGQEVLFQEGRHYAAYADEQELFEKIDYYLTHREEREAVALAGLEEVRRNHRLEQRIDRLLSTIRSNELVAPIRSMSPSQVDHLYAWLYEYWRAPEAGLRLIREARLAGRPWWHLLPATTRSILRMVFR